MLTGGDIVMLLCLCAICWLIGYMGGYHDATIKKERK